MRKRTCSVCGTGDIPLNETIKVDGNVYCESCFETSFTKESQLEGKEIEKEIDPTVCSSCEKDFGETELTKIANFPVCPSCETDIRNRTFPTWVKAFFVGVLIVVVGSIVWNWKFYTAYMDIQKSISYTEQGDYGMAAALMIAASEKVPEVEDLQAIGDFYRGLDLLIADSSTKALDHFNKCKG